MHKAFQDYPKTPPRISRRVSRNRMPESIRELKQANPKETYHNERTV